MGKKYLLTFSLAAISCLATKSIQQVLVAEQKVEHIIKEREIVNNEISTNEHQLEENFKSKLNLY